MTPEGAVVYDLMDNVVFLTLLRYSKLFGAMLSKYEAYLYERYGGYAANALTPEALREAFEQGITITRRLLADMRAMFPAARRAYAFNCNDGPYAYPNFDQHRHFVELAGRLGSWYSPMRGGMSRHHPTVRAACLPPMAAI